MHLNLSSEILAPEDSRLTVVRSLWGATEPQYRLALAHSNGAEVFQLSGLTARQLATLAEAIDERLAHDGQQTARPRPVTL